MMKRAGRVHGLRALAAVLMLGLLTWGGIEGYGISGRRLWSNRSRPPARPMFPASSNRSPVTAAGRIPSWLVCSRTPNHQAGEHLHASLALLPVDPRQVDYLRERLLTASPGDVSVLREALQPHQASVSPKLWEVVAAAKPDDPRLLPAASALALLDPKNDRWKQAGLAVSDALVGVNATFLGAWTDLLQPVRSTLTPRLASIFKDTQRSDSERSLATNVLTDYASDDPDLLADLLMAADPKAYQKLFPVVQNSRRNRTPVPSGDPKEGESRRSETNPSRSRTDLPSVRPVRRWLWSGWGKPRRSSHCWCHSADPRLRSFIVNWLNPLGADPTVVAAELDRRLGATPGLRREPAGTRRSPP